MSPENKIEKKLTMKCYKATAKNEASAFHY